MANVFYSIASLGSFFSGKDRYTQTRFPNYDSRFLLKGADWVDTGDNNKFNLYNTTAHLKAVIDRKALMKANVRYKHKRKSGDQEVTVENSPFIYLLENPNFLQSGNEFIQQRDILKSIYGNGIIYMNKAGQTPKLLWNLPVNQMVINRTGKLFKQIDISGVIENYELKAINQGGINETYDVNDIIHLRDPNPNDPVKGLSKLEGLMMPISNVRGALGFRNRIITSNAMLGILSSEVRAAAGMDPAPMLDEDEQKKISEGFQNRYGMQEGKSDILQTQAGVRWTPLSYPTKDLLLFEEVDEDFRSIIDAFGLNANIFSFSGQSTYENMEHGIRLAYRDTIIPESENEALAFSKAFGMDGEKEWIEACFDHLDLLKTDESEVHKRNAETIEIMLRSGVSVETISEILGVELGKIRKVEANPVG